VRICLLCYRGNPYSGGQGIYLKYVAEEMVRQGHEVHAIAGPPYPLDMQGVVLHRIPNNHYSVRKGRDIINSGAPFDILGPIKFYEYMHSRLGAFPEISSFGYRAYALLRELHARYGFDIIHDNQSLGYGLLLMKSLGIPVAATIHHPLSIDLKNVLERSASFVRKFRQVMFYPILMQIFVSRRLDHVITVSEDSRVRINRDFGVPVEKQTVVYNGIDTGIFRPLDNVSKKKGKIIFVGNVEDGKKGFVYLLKAMTGVRDDVMLTAVDGGAPHHRITQALVRKLNLEGRIEFTGKISTEELVRHYSESEIAIVPSVYEGFGLPAGEAMACGVPVISSDGGALPEVVGDAGVVIPARDEESLAGAINALIADPEKMEQMRENGMRRVNELFNWKRSVEQMLEVFERLVS